MKNFKLFLATLGVVFAGNSFAQQKITASDVVIEQGKTAEVLVSIEFKEKANTAEFVVELPEGITLVDAKKGELLTTEKQVVEMQGTKVIAYPNDYGEDVFASESGVFAILTIQADADLDNGELTGKITQGGIGDLNGDIVETEDAEFKITVKEPEPDPDAWYKNANFQLTCHDFVSGVKESGIAPHWVKDPVKDGNNCIQVVSNDNPSAEYDSQLFIYLTDETAEDDKVKLSMKVRADAEATVPTQVHSTPGSWKGNLWGNLTIGTEWATLEKEYTIGDASVKTLVFNLSKGATANKFYFDDITVTIEKAPDPIWSNIVVNGNCATTNNAAFSYKIKKQYYKAEIVDGAGKDETRGVVVTSDDSPANDWDTQFFITINHKFAANEKFKLKMDYRADLEGDATATGQFQSHKACAAEMPEAGLTEADEVTDPETQHIGTYIGNISGFSNLTFKNDWQTFEGEGKATADMQSICLNLSVLKESTKYYFDNIIVEIDENKATPEDLAVIGEVANEGEDVATGVKSLNTAEKNGALYNLAGQKVDKNFKGIVIENGKKRFNK